MIITLLLPLVTSVSYASTPFDQIAPLLDRALTVKKSVYIGSRTVNEAARFPTLGAKWPHRHAQIAADARAHAMTMLHIKDADVLNGRVFERTLLDMDKIVKRLRFVSNAGTDTVGAVVLESMINLRADTEVGVSKRSAVMAWLETVVVKTVRAARLQTDRVKDFVLAKIQTPPAPITGRFEDRERQAADQYFVDAILAQRNDRLDELLQGLYRGGLLHAEPGAHRPRWFRRTLERSREDKVMQEMIIKALVVRPQRNRYFDAQLRKLTVAIWDFAGLDTCDIAFLLDDPDQSEAKARAAIQDVRANFPLGLTIR